MNVRHMYSLYILELLEDVGQIEPSYVVRISSEPSHTEGSKNWVKLFISVALVRHLHIENA
jgi:hypothetical protein